MKPKNATSVARKSIATIKGKAVAIIGGGIGGLTAALAFCQRGASVTVFEQANELREVGAGVQITPNGARVLDALNVHPKGVIAQAVVPMDGLSGKAVTRFDLSKKTPAYTFVHRAELIGSLAAACEACGVTIELGQRVTEAPDGFDLVVAADGIRSAIRPQIAGNSEPFFTRQVAWRAIANVSAAPEAKIWMLPGAHVVTYPLDNNRLNIVAVQERTEWAEEGWSFRDSPQNLTQAFSNASNDLTDILNVVTETHLWGLFRHPVADLWHRDNVVLLGDAAHPTLPFLAQGANLAIEDAFVLARACDEHGIASGLRRYAQLRTPRVTRAIAAANANAKNYHLRGLSRSLSFMALQGIGLVAPNAFLNRLSWLYDHDVKA